MRLIAFLSACLLWIGLAAQPVPPSLSLGASTNNAVAHTFTVVIYTNCMVVTPSMILTNVAVYTWTNALSNAFALSWDRSPEPDIACYRLYYGPTSPAVTNIINVPGAGTTSLALFNILSPATNYWFWLTVFNTSGLESDRSEILISPGK